MPITQIVSYIFRSPNHIYQLWARASFAHARNRPWSEVLLEASLIRTQEYRPDRSQISFLTLLKHFAYAPGSQSVRREPQSGSSGISSGIGVCLFSVLKWFLFKLFKGATENVMARVTSRLKHFSEYRAIFPHGQVEHLPTALKSKQYIFTD